MGEEKRVVTRAIILFDGKVLLGKRVRNEGAGQYALIGGKPEENETPEDTVVREVNGETGILFKNIHPWKRETDKKSVAGENWTVYYFYGEGEGPLKLKDDEVSDVIFVTKENYEDFDLAFDHKKILSEFFESVLD